MPIYEYRCSDCGFQKEFLQKISDPLLTTCTSCGKETFQKMLTAAGFQLKGSGWYATDFKNSGSKPAEKADGAVKGKPVAGDAAKSDSAKSEGGGDSGSKSTETAAAPAAAAKTDSGSTSSSGTSSGTSSGSTTAA